MTTSQSDRLDKLEAALEANTEAIKQLGEQVSSLATSVTELKEDLKGWTTWLRSATTIILFSVALTLIGLVVPIAIGLWRQSFV